MIELTKTTVTVEFPLTNELVEMDKQYLFELIRQQIAELMRVDANEVWIKSISAVTDYKMPDDIAAEA